MGNSVSKQQKAERLNNLESSVGQYHEEFTDLNTRFSTTVEPQLETAILDVQKTVSAVEELNKLMAQNMLMISEIRQVLDTKADKDDLFSRIQEIESKMVAGSTSETENELMNRIDSLESKISTIEESVVENLLIEPAVDTELLKRVELLESKVKSKIKEKIEETNDSKPETKKKTTGTRKRSNTLSVVDTSQSGDI